VETLGCVTVICSDKTGTLTKNEMTVKYVFAGGNLFEVTGIGYEPKGEFLLNKKPINLSEYPELKNAIISGILCNGAKLINDNGTYKIMGDPTEVAIITAAAKLGLSKEDLEEEFPFIEEIPFDSERKKMTVLRKSDGKIIAYVKGAPDILLANCAKIEENGTIKELNEKNLQMIQEINDNLANQAMRVLGVAYRIFDSEPTSYHSESIEKDLTFLGLIAMIDPPREEVKLAINKCKTAGIKTVMITGDHKSTAIAIAKELGFFDEGSSALTGVELDQLSDSDFEKHIEHIPVYARVSPEHKLRIVRTKRKLGEITAMTGDGVNDAPAVKEADIGIAMGITGTDVTKEVSDMVVTDDNFASIVSAVEEGRGIYDNIRKFVHYLLSCNAGEILVMFVASLFGWASPLLPIQILWVNLVTDGLPALALGVDPVDPNVMKRSPRPPNEPVLTRQSGIMLIGQGLIIAFCSLFVYRIALLKQPDNLVHARTLAFFVLACSQLFHSYNCRNSRESLFKIGLLTNKKLIYATGVSFLLQIMVVYIPFLQSIFKIDPLKPLELGFVILVSSVPLWVMEIIKLIIRARKG
ncbi:MAG: cation-translocating P-type ATPase, partial [Candidatus Poribacteria bacterium]